MYEPCDLWIGILLTISYPATTAWCLCYYCYHILNKRKNVETGGTFHLCDVNTDHRAHCQLIAKLHQQFLWIEFSTNSVELQTTKQRFKLTFIQLEGRDNCSLCTHTVYQKSSSFNCSRTKIHSENCQQSYNSVPVSGSRKGPLVYPFKWRP